MYCRSIVVKAVFEPQLGMISQLEDGLKTYGFLQEVKIAPNPFEPLFVAGASKMFEVTSEEFLADLVVEYNEKQVERQAEEDTFKFFIDFVEFLFHAGKKNTESLNLICYYR